MHMIETVTPNQAQDARLLQNLELDAVSGGGTVGSNETITVGGGRTEGREEVYYTITLTKGY